MNEMNQEDWLDRQLREAAPYIDDEGFTARVLQQLPPRRRHRDLLRAAILLGMTLLASLLAYVVSGGGRFVSVTLERLATLPALWVFVLALASGLVIAAVGATAAIFKGRALQPGVLQT
jgi:anti-sigma factor RsiW